jgi:hypothetical protein
VRRRLCAPRFGRSQSKALRLDDLLELNRNASSLVERRKHARGRLRDV